MFFLLEVLKITLSIQFFSLLSQEQNCSTSFFKLPELMLTMTDDYFKEDELNV